ncbi:glycerophosphodiester phosphodiesterase family protein [Nicoletella semolina]|uniref:glycerophosphodiester phosphodiesterase family protein n=1 Tax=Nicoletella semolina TaxID=271160 RepID=UPI001FB64A1A|nr:glycerophosphodiester phosphodiesterase family protein [Nicoletella semolina]
MHDETLDRTTNVQEIFPDLKEKSGKFAGKMLASKLTLSQIQQLKLIDGFDGQIHRVPTLREALEVAKGKVWIDLDLKEMDLNKLVELTQEFGTDNLLAYNRNADKLKEVNDKTGILSDSF